MTCNKMLKVNVKVKPRYKGVFLLLNISLHSNCSIKSKPQVCGEVEKIQQKPVRVCLYVYWGRTQMQLNDVANGSKFVRPDVTSAGLLLLQLRARERAGDLLTLIGNEQIKGSAR